MAAAAPSPAGDGGLAADQERRPLIGRSTSQPDNGRQIVAVILLSVTNGAGKGYNGSVMAAVMPRMVALWPETFTPWHQGLVVAISGLGMVLGGLGAGYLNYTFRKRVVAIWGEVFTVFAIVAGVILPHQLFWLTRFSLGLGMALCTITKNLLIAELSPVSARGSILTFTPLGWSAGLFAAEVADAFFVKEDTQWIYIVLFGAIFHVATAAVVLLVPDPPDDTNKDTGIAVSNTTETSMRDYLKIPRGEVLCALVVAAGVALNGGVPLNNYTSFLFRELFPGEQELARVGPTEIGLAAMSGDLLAIAIVDRVPRRSLWLTGLFTCIFCNTMLVLCIAAPGFAEV